MHSNDLNTTSSPDELPSELRERMRLNGIEDLRTHLSEMSGGELLFLSDRMFDAAIVGVADRIGMESVVVYNTTKIIDILEADGMDREEATEFYEFNILGAYVGERTPMFIGLVDDLML